MGLADRLRSQFGANLADSLGARAVPPAAAGSPLPHLAGPTPPPPPVAAPRPEDGRGRAREAGHMEIDRITPDPDQPRKEFDETSICNLALSLAAHGQLQPLRVRWNPALGKWVIVAGERRYRAALRAGMKTVACIFLDGELAPSDILEEQLIENLQREDLKPIEAAQAYRNLMDSNGWSVNDLAAELCLGDGTIRKALALLTLPADIQAQVDAGQLPATSAYQVSRIPDDTTRRAIVAQVEAQHLTRDQTEALVQRHTASTGQGRGGARARRITNRVFATQAGPRITCHRPGGLNAAILRAALVEVLAQVEAELAQVGQDQLEGQAA